MRLFNNPKNVAFVGDETLPLFSPCFKEIFINLKENKEVKLAKLSSEATDFFNYLTMKAEVGYIPLSDLLCKEEVPEFGEKDIIEETQNCLQQIQALAIKSKLDCIYQEIKKAEEEKNFNKAEELSREFHHLIKNI